MAKPENPAEAPVAARPPRPVQRVRLDALAEGALAHGDRAEGALPERQLSDARAGGALVGNAGSRAPSAAGASIDLERRAARQLLDDAFDATAFDTARNLETPDGFLAEDGFIAEDGFDAEGARAGELNAERSFSEDDGFDAADGHAGHAVGDDAARVEQGAARNPSLDARPGLAWVRRHVSGSWAHQAANGSPEASGSRAAQAANGSAATASRAPKVPMASLELPSTSRLDLTPSPVPRVALAPATGAVDISLVPGPHTIGSRNLPTLAAQHLLGRRAPRRPAPAVTLPPPPSREPRSAFTLARNVRSSKGEIVLGLTIGLGVSLLLAGLGQAYLRGDAIADGAGADGSSAPEQVESVTLSARPELAPAGSVSEATRGGVGAAASGAQSPASGDAPPRRAAGVASGRIERDGNGARRPAGAAVGGGVAGDAVLLAQATVAKRTERTPPRATPARATRPRPAQRAESAPANGSVVSPAAVALPSEPPPASAPMTPAESAGLGLDLPL
jgi:hypothetical protein